MRLSFSSSSRHTETKPQHRRTLSSVAEEALSCAWLTWLGWDRILSTGASQEVDSMGKSRKGVLLLVHSYPNLHMIWLSFSSLLWSCVVFGLKFSPIFLTLINLCLSFIRLQFLLYPKQSPTNSELPRLQRSLLTSNLVHRRRKNSLAGLSRA